MTDPDSIGRTDAEEFDEYLWPLTDAAWPLNWSRLAEEQRLRHRLGEILTHVRDAHVQPRVRRLGDHPSPAAVTAATQAIIAGPVDGPFWERTLKAPVPRVLRDEWQELSAALRELCEPASPQRPRRRG